MPLSDTAVKDTEKIISVRDMIAWLATLLRFRPNPKLINLAHHNQEVLLVSLGYMHITIFQFLYFLTLFSIPYVALWVQFYF